MFRNASLRLEPARISVATKENSRLRTGWHLRQFVRHHPERPVQPQPGFRAHHHQVQRVGQRETDILLPPVHQVFQHQSRNEEPEGRRRGHQAQLHQARPDDEGHPYPRQHGQRQRAQHLRAAQNRHGFRLVVSRRHQKTARQAGALHIRRHPFADPLCHLGQLEGQWRFLRTGLVRSHGLDWGRGDLLDGFLRPGVIAHAVEHNYAGQDKKQYCGDDERQHIGQTLKLTILRMIK